MKEVDCVSIMNMQNGVTEVVYSKILLLTWLYYPQQARCRKRKCKGSKAFQIFQHSIKYPRSPQSFACWQSLVAKTPVHATHFHGLPAFYSRCIHRNHPRPKLHSITTSLYHTYVFVRIKVLLFLLRFALLHPDTATSEVVRV
jgi:hypothetical protein